MSAAATARKRAPSQPVATPSPLAVFTARAEARALLWQAGEFDLYEAVDALQASAVASGLIAKLGQDEVQRLMADAFHAVAAARLDDDERGICNIDTPGGPQEMLIVSEPGLYDGLSSTFAALCRAADQKQRRKPTDPTRYGNITRHTLKSGERGRPAAQDAQSQSSGIIERARRLLAGDDVSLERAYAEVSKPSGVAASTIKAANYLVRAGDAEPLQRWLDKHSAPEREAILQHLEKRQRTQAK